MGGGAASRVLRRRGQERLREADQLADIAAVLGADSHGVLEPEPGKFRVEIAMLLVVHLVNDEHHRLVHAAQPPDEFRVDRSEPILAIHHQQDDIRRLQRRSRPPRAPGR